MRNVRAYIQSGNAIFQSEGMDTEQVASRITATIDRRHGFAPRVILQTLAELKKAVAANPYSEAASRPRTLHLVFWLRRRGGRTSRRWSAYDPRACGLRSKVACSICTRPRAWGIRSASRASKSRWAQARRATGGRLATPRPSRARSVGNVRSRMCGQAPVTGEAIIFDRLPG